MIESMRVIAALFALVLVANPAWAGLSISHPKDHIELEHEDPELVLSPDEYAHNVYVTLTRDDGQSLEFTLGKVRANEKKTITWDTSPGNWYYTADVRIVYPNGREDEISYTFNVVGALKPKLTVPRETIDMEGCRLQLSLDQPLGSVDFKVLGEDLETVAKTTRHFTDVGPNQQVEVSWEGCDRDPFQIVVRATDAYDYRWAEVELNPWSLVIPHEDVHFATASYEITPEEAPKLDKAYELIAAAVRKYGNLVQAKLYVAGYTDTVGSAADNMTLSRNRARAIATYFKNKGFTFPIHYQGFGEGVLKVPTPDNTDMLANRRALYMIAADAPLKSGDLPRSNWTQVK
jgi:outer membrane protein OmpA-like peptidoglycan-associated protein